MLDLDEVLVLFMQNMFIYFQREFRLSKLILVGVFGTSMFDIR